LGTGELRFPEPAPASEEAVEQAAARLKAAGRKGCLFLGGEALIADHGALQNLGRCAAATGATMLMENAFARADRGADLPSVARIPYFPRDAKRALDRFDFILLVGARKPVALFGYEDGPSQLIGERSGQGVVSLEDPDVPALTKRLMGRLNASATPFKTPAPVKRPEATGPLDATKLCAVIANLQPENAIIVDEALTSSTNYESFSATCPRFSHLALTGGAIGFGPPSALGAAIACPDRRVINFQADGSGLYSVQALWSQAQEEADVVTIVCRNEQYNILKVELDVQKIGPDRRGSNTRKMCGVGGVDWVAVARGFGVPSTRVTTAEELTAELAEALKRKGPTLIEAMLVPGLEHVPCALTYDEPAPAPAPAPAPEPEPAPTPPRPTGVDTGTMTGEDAPPEDLFKDYQDPEEVGELPSGLDQIASGVLEQGKEVIRATSFNSFFRDLNFKMPDLNWDDDE